MVERSGGIRFPWVTHNFGLKLFSFALALAGWAYFRFAPNAPSITAQFDQQLSVPITVTGLQGGYVARFGEKQALVTVVPSRNGETIKPDQVKAVLNLSQRNAGVYSIPLQIIAPNIEISSIQPPSITLTVDRLIDRPFPVAVAYGGDRHGLVVSEIVVTPRQVTVRGIATDLERIAALRLVVPFPATASTYDAMVRPVPVAVPGSDHERGCCLARLGARARGLREGTRGRRLSKLFGTDGVRGVANRDLTPELAFKLGRAGAAVLAPRRPMEFPIVVGRDTRVSGTMLEAAIVAGITSTGRNVISVGIIPTPGVARVTTAIDAAAGVMISASHNPIEDNGIKFFGPDGFKLTDDDEARIESVLDADDLPRPTHLDVGMAEATHGLIDRYLFSLIEIGADLGGMTIVVDAAFGAAFEIGPEILRQLGAEVIALHAEDDGSRINVQCGATDLRPLAAAVRDAQANGKKRAVGVAFDGDADRALFVDETGQSISGDHVMLVLGRELHRAGELPGATIVGTVMSNVGLERALDAEGIRLERAAVGDRYVLEMLRAAGYRFGGEQSGHIIDLARNTTGDGPATAVALFGIVSRSGGTLHEIAAGLTVYPQVLVNVRVEARREAIAQSPPVAAAIESVSRELGADGRILVRPSGTEPLVRVMLEGRDRAQIDRLAGEVAAAIEGLSGR